MLRIGRARMLFEHEPHFPADFPNTKPPVDSVDVSADRALDFSGETRRVLSLDAANRATSCRNPPCSFDYAFSPTCNSATLKGTPHPPIPQ